MAAASLAQLRESQDLSARCSRFNISRHQSSAWASGGRAGGGNYRGSHMARCYRSVLLPAMLEIAAAPDALVFVNREPRPRRDQIDGFTSSFQKPMLQYIPQACGWCCVGACGFRVRQGYGCIASQGMRSFLICATCGSWEATRLHPAWSFFLLLYCSQTCGEQHFWPAQGFLNGRSLLKMGRRCDSRQSGAKHSDCIMPTRSSCCDHGFPAMTRLTPPRGQIRLVCVHVMDRWFTHSTLTGGNDPFSNAFSGVVTRWTHGLKPKDLGNLPSGY